MKLKTSKNVASSEKKFETKDLGNELDIVGLRRMEQNGKSSQEIMLIITLNGEYGCKRKFGNYGQLFHGT